jgi:hypothetical protein
MMNNMPIKTCGILIALPALALMVLVSSCAGQGGQGGQSTQTEYSNPGRSADYSADERSYEKPWPFGDLNNNPQH